MPRARGWAPCGATPTSSGEGMKTNSQGSPSVSSHCSVAQPPCSNRADGWSTRRVRASPKRTRWSSIDFSPRSQAFDLLDLRRDGRAELAPVLDDARDAPHAPLRPSSRGLLRRSAPTHSLTPAVRYNVDVDPSTFPRLEPRQVLRPDGRPWRRLSWCFSAHRCGSRCGPGRCRCRRSSVARSTKPRPRSPTATSHFVSKRISAPTTRSRSGR